MGHKIGQQATHQTIVLPHIRKERLHLLEMQAYRGPTARLACAYYSERHPPFGLARTPENRRKRVEKLSVAMEMSIDV
jgi:hypothetical protein